MGLRGEARLHYVNLRNRELTGTAGDLLRIAQAGHLERTGAVGQLFAGLASYVRNDLFKARDHFQAVLATRGRGGMACALDSGLGLTLASQALGDEQQAHAVLLEMAVLLDAAETKGPFRLLRSCQARLALGRGDLDEAGRLLRTIRDDNAVAHPSYIEVPEITLARWLLLQGMPSSLEEVAAIVDGLRLQASVRGHVLGVLRAELVSSLLLQARGDMEGAISTLRDVVALARPGDVLRHFVDFGPPMQHLLVDLESRTVPADPYLAKLLAAFPATTGPLLAAAPSRRDGETPSLDALSPRELEVLTLLEARLSNKEIAGTLYIAPETVKRHTLLLTYTCRPRCVTRRSGAPAVPAR
jgi:LuxR family maltose regulon positive regulatory protein